MVTTYKVTPCLMIVNRGTGWPGWTGNTGKLGDHLSVETGMQDNQLSGELGYRVTTCHLSSDSQQGWIQGAKPISFKALRSEDIMSIDARLLEVLITTDMDIVFLRASLLNIHVLCTTLSLTLQIYLCWWNTSSNRIITWMRRNHENTGLYHDKERVEFMWGC